LRIAAQIREDGKLPGMVSNRYSSFDEGFGKDFKDGKLTLEDCEARAFKEGEPKQFSGKQELYESILNHYM
jgi:xylose isomerase